MFVLTVVWLEDAFGREVQVTHGTGAGDDVARSLQ